MNKFSQIFVAAVCACLTLAPLAVHAAPARPGLHWGPDQKLGAGHARAWVAVDMDGRASSMGVSLDDNAAAQLRNDAGRELVLPLPTTAGVRSPGFRADSKLAFRVRYDVRTHTQITLLEGLPSAPALLAAR